MAAGVTAVRGRRLVEQPGALGVAPRRRARGPSPRPCGRCRATPARRTGGLALAGGHDALADRRRRVRAGRGARRRGAADGDRDVDPVEQRAAEAAADGGRGRRPSRTAGGGGRGRTDTGRRRHEHRSGSGNSRALPAHDRHAPVLGGPPQSLSARRANSASSSRNSTPWWASVTSPGTGRPPPDEPRRRDRCGAVPGTGARRSRARRPSAGRRRVDPRHLERLGARRAAAGSTGIRRASIVLPVPGGPRGGGCGRRPRRPGSPAARRAVAAHVGHVGRARAPRGRRDRARRRAAEQDLGRPREDVDHRVERVRPR